MTASYFPSPATDYIEQRLTVTAACDISANSQVIQTDRGYVVLDLSLKVTQGSVVLIRCAGELQFAKLMGQSLIKVDGGTGCSVLSYKLSLRHRTTCICPEQFWMMDY